MITASAPVVIRSDTPSGVAVVSLNRPDRANAFTPRMAAELCDVLEAAASDSAVSGIVLTGAGAKFCAGMDSSVVAEIAAAVECGASAAAALQPTLLAVQRATNLIATSDKPVVAAINGAAAAGGLDIAMACDYRVSSDAATFVESYARLGLPPLNGSSFLFRGQISRSAAFRLLSTAERIDAAQALAIGLVDQLCLASNVLATAVDLAERMSIGGPDLVRYIKDELGRGSGERFADALSRAFVAGVHFADSPRFRDASGRLTAGRVAGSITTEQA